VSTPPWGNPAHTICPASYCEYAVRHASSEVIGRVAPSRYREALDCSPTRPHPNTEADVPAGYTPGASATGNTAYDKGFRSVNTATSAPRSAVT
jgi:hypothetical protein